MGRSLLFAILATLMLVACKQQDTTMPDDLNRRAYALRYVDVDSSLHYADKAYALSSDYPDGQAEAMNHRAFVWYQRMLFSRAMEELARVDSVTTNQVELLCADVMRMKITQRTGELRMFYRAWHEAERRLMRIDEELDFLSQHHQDRVLYARTEMHIIASTYYYYTSQPAASREAIHQLDSYMLLPRDTAQWCNYMYMLGDGGMLEGDSVLVELKEFDYLTHVLSLAQRRKDKYFQANALQSLSLALETPTQRDRIKSMQSGGLNYILGQYTCLLGDVCEDSLSLTLVEHALSLFREYRDRYQTANVLRTKSELLFRRGRYAEALPPLLEALDIVEEQHRIESKCVPYWEARIYERLSLTYSALGNKAQAQEARDIYLSFLGAMRQNLEVGVRTEELQDYNTRLHISLSVIAVMVLAVIIIFWIQLRRLKKRTLRQEREAEETLQLTKDETRAREMELAREKLMNIERRANVSLAENVVPYINRMLHTQDMEYVTELSTEILRINDTLTKWIQVKRGMVAVNISTFALQPLLCTIAKNRATFTRRNLTLDIPTVDVSVKADRALTLFMINTLCDNARKFTPPGGRVSILVDATDSVVEVSVCDTGCGLSPENVDMINNSKVYRIQSSRHDEGQESASTMSGEGHGSGFGLMNCRGIIEQMKKLSSRFHCCDFGVESTEGQGSRFWFRLPRVLMMVLAFGFGLMSWAQGDAADTVSYSSSANKTEKPASDYAAAWQAYQGLCNSNYASRYQEALDYGARALALVPGDSIALRMHIEKEMAFASQSLMMWDEYRHHNTQSLRLHRILTADPNLPIYAQRLHMLQSEISGAIFFTFLLFLGSVFSLVLIVRRSRRRRGEMLRQEEIQIQQDEALSRVQYELDRVHIQNRILDNCLSTIKHETMYYPARIQRMAQSRDVDVAELTQLMNYYHEVYTILLEQAQRQITSRPALDEGMLAELKRRIMSAIGNAPSTISVTEKGNIQEIRVKPLQAGIPDNLFTPDAGNLDAFVAREIVRMHDASCGYPGLRLYVQNNEIIITLWKNSRLSSLKTFSWN